MADQVRKNIYAWRISEEETALAHRVAEHVGVPISNLLRMLVREKARQLGLENTKKTKR